MNKILLILLIALPATASADLDNLPGDTVWYLHADLAGMRNTESGRQLYDWVNGEVFVELNDEIGIDVSKEVDRITAFSADDAGVVVVVEGPVTKTTQDKLLALVTLKSAFDTRKFGDQVYYFAGDEDAQPDHNDPMGDLDEAAYFSFSVDNRMLITSSEEQMQELLQRNGRITGSGTHAGALFVLTADRSFMQAGMRAERFVDDDDDWNSNILRNTEQVSLLVADSNGMLAVEALLKSRDAAMAQSIGNVINGLIGLQAFNGDLDQDLRGLIANTQVSVRDAELTLRTVFDPAMVVRMLDD